MVQSLNYAFKHEHLSTTQKQGIIKVIPKKRKDRSYLENWRPLTLLNVDYKIATNNQGGSNWIRQRPLYWVKY